MQNVAEKLKSFDIRPSVHRLAIYRYLDEKRNHPTAEMIFQALQPENPTLSRTTVYNTLKLFEENKIVMPLTIEDGELRYDINTSFHGHFKCRKCHSVTDIFLDDPNAKIPLPQNGCKVESIHLDFYGLCMDCQE